MTECAHTRTYRFDSRASCLDARVIKNSYVSSERVPALVPREYEFRISGTKVTQQVVISLTNNIA